MKIEDKIAKMQEKYNITITDLDIDNNYVKIKDKDGYEYELSYLGISRIRMSNRNMTNDSYIKKYKLKFKLDELGYEVLDINKDKIHILNLKTNISTWQPKYNFNLKRIESLTTKSNKYIELVKNKLGTKWDYSKLEYNGMKSEAIIICPYHGEFKVNWGNLVAHDHQGCTTCTFTQRKFGRQGFINTCNKLNKKGILYVLKFTKDNEEFFKIGITSNLDIRRSKFPYETELINKYEGDPGDIYDLEKVLHKKFTSDLYIPNIKFNGYLECFKFDNINKSLNIILEFSNKILKVLID